MVFKIDVANFDIDDFIWTPINPTTEDIIQFTDLSTDRGVVNWSWDFDDGTISYKQHPTHQYTVAGNYSVCLTVTDNNDASNSTCKQLTVIPLNQPPVADFTYSPIQPNAGETIFFADISYDLDGIIVDWYWEFGDGDTSPLQNPTHSYSTSGRYQMTLTVTDDEEASDTHIKTIPVGLDLSPVQDLSSGWNLASLPFNISMDKNEFLLKHGDYFYGWSDGVVSDFMFGWDRPGQYYTFSDVLNPGNGYWLYSYEDCELWIESFIPVYDEYVTGLDVGWNLMGVPYYENVNKVDILVDDTDWDTAVGNGWISDFVFGWDRSGQSYNFADTFMPGHAYWVYAYQQCTLKRNES